MATQTGLHPQALSPVHTCGFQCRHHLPHFCLSPGIWMCCQITPDSCAGEAPSMEYHQHLSLPPPLGPRSVPSMYLCMMLPPSVRCSQGERMEAVPDPCACTGSQHPNSWCSLRHVPARDSTSVCWLSILQGLSPECPCLCGQRKRSFCLSSVLKSPPKIPQAVGVSRFSTNMGQCRSCLCRSCL